MADSARINVPASGAAVEIKTPQSQKKGAVGDAFLIRNAGTVSLELGDSDIETSGQSFQGFDPNDKVGVTLGENERIFARVGSGSTDGEIHVLRLQ